MVKMKTLGYAGKLSSIHRTQDFLVYPVSCSAAWGCHSGWYCHPIILSPLLSLLPWSLAAFSLACTVGLTLWQLSSWTFTWQKGFGALTFCKWIIFTINLYNFSGPMSSCRAQINRQTFSKTKSAVGSWRKQILWHNPVTKPREQ